MQKFEGHFLLDPAFLENPKKTIPLPFIFYPVNLLKSLYEE
jgi:hypothetical protein